jgi:hypothetical protein
VDDEKEEYLIAQMIGQLEQKILREVEERDAFRKELDTYQDPELLKLYVKSDDRLALMALEVVKFTGSYRVICQRIQDQLFKRKNGAGLKTKSSSSSLVKRSTANMKWSLFRQRNKSGRLKFPPPLPTKGQQQQGLAFNQVPQEVFLVENVSPDGNGSMSMSEKGARQRSGSEDSQQVAPILTRSMTADSNSFIAPPPPAMTAVTHANTINSSVVYVVPPSVTFDSSVVDKTVLRDLKEYSKWKSKAHLLLKHSTDSKHVFDMLEVAVSQDLRAMLKDKQTVQQSLNEIKAQLDDMVNQRNNLFNILTREKDPRIAELEQQVEIFSREKAAVMEKYSAVENNLKYFEFKYHEQEQYIANLERTVKVTGKSSDTELLKQKSDLEMKIVVMTKQVIDWDFVEFGRR